jgi:hypothetical protein
VMGKCALLKRVMELKNLLQCVDVSFWDDHFAMLSPSLSRACANLTQSRSQGRLHLQKLPFFALHHLSSKWTPPAPSSRSPSA